MGLSNVRVPEAKDQSCWDSVRIVAGLQAS